MINYNKNSINRELSWLSFDDRVLQEADDVNVPLIERIKFLGIFSNNRDEFFRVRVATLKRMVSIGKKAEEMFYGDPLNILQKIQQTVLKQQKRFENIYQKILHELENKGIFIINELQLDKEQ